MSDAKNTNVPKEAVQAVAVHGTPMAEQDATLDESQRSLPVVDASERPIFGPLNRSAPAATENVVAVETSANSTQSGTPSKSDAEDRSKSSRSSGEASAHAESDATIPFGSSGSISGANSSVDDSRRSLPAVRSGEVGVRANASLNNSSADIPYDSTGNLSETTGTFIYQPSITITISKTYLFVIPKLMTLPIRPVLGSASNSLPPHETSTEVAIRELRKAAKDTPKQKPFPYPRLELDENGSPLKPINESSEPSGRSETPKTPQWHQQNAYRSLSPKKTSEAPPSSTNPADTASPTPVVAAEDVSVDTVPSASNGSSMLSSPPASSEPSAKVADSSVDTLPSASTLSSPPASPSETSAQVAGDASVATLPSASSGRRESTISSPPASPNTSAEAAVPVAEASPNDTLPSASTGDVNVSTLSTPPATPETSGQVAVRNIHEELRGVIPSKLLRVDRDYMDLDNTPLSIVAEGTEPSQNSGNIDELTWNRALAYRSSSEEPMDTSGPKPKPKATKRRVPNDADINDTPPARRIAQAHRSRHSTASSVSSGPCASKDVRHSRRHCPTCRCDDTMFPPIDEVNDALYNFDGYFEEDAPADAASDVESVAPALDELSSDESSMEDPLADMESDDEVPAEPPVQACPRCGRNCTCVPVQIPEEVEPPRRRAPRRQPKMSLEDAWKALKFIDDFKKTDLPAAPPKFDDDFNMLEFRPLNKDRIKKYGFTDDFQVALYEDGEVVFQGSFPGVKSTTELLRRAIYQPVLAYHVPEDKVVDIEVGDDFFVMITKAGHFLSLGANDEGQLGATANPGRFRQRAVTPATMRRFPKKIENQVGDIVFTEIAVVGKTVFATDKEGRTFMCGEGFEPLLTWEEEEDED
uniref:Rab-GAP TBC domain-containing protein n=1 Tax=Panagrellus redivivus TaxID=6233 RepID=A0A7E4W6I6_PANRE